MDDKTMLEMAAYIEVNAGVRYWEDATVNGTEDTDGALIPFRHGDRWKPCIRLADGYVMDWPEGMTADIHYKVCDDGLYCLCDANLAPLTKWRDSYVPGDFLCHGDHGYGDYIIFKVGPDGMIQNYRRPHIDASEWDWRAASGIGKGMGAE